MAKPGFSPRYPSLPLISMILKLLAYLQLAFGIVVTLVFTYSLLRTTGSGFGAAVSYLFPQLFKIIISFVALLAGSELIHVFLDIESNTRRTAEAAQGYDMRSTPRADSLNL